MTNEITPDPDTWPKAPSGDTLFTVEVVNADDLKLLIKTSGKNVHEAVSHACREAAEETDQVSAFEEELGEGEEFDDGAYECEVSMAVDMTRSIRAWPGHHDTAPELPPLYQD